jgi:hypothetical protein
MTETIIDREKYTEWKQMPIPLIPEMESHSHAKDLCQFRRLHTSMRGYILDSKHV